MNAAVMLTADAIKPNHHCGETDVKILLKDCMVRKAQVRELREQNISSTEELTGYVSRAPVASACTTRRIKNRIQRPYAGPYCTAGVVARLSSHRSGWCA